MLNNASILVTGGTGSFGSKFIETMLRDYPSAKRVVVYSRDELKQFEMSQRFPLSDHPQLRYFIGDVRDKERLAMALEGIDTVVHAAALKQVPACEYNPFEAIMTNVIGAQNLIEGCIKQGVRRVVALSTDKAAAPINLYGATKLCSDKLFTSANNIVGGRDLRFSVVRYGNVFGSRGSVIPFFLERRHEASLPITDPRMTRFNITLEEGIAMVTYALEHMWGGEVFVPKIPSYRITDVAAAVAPGCEQKIIGIRPGEKLHEEMITETDALRTLEMDRYYVILPATPSWDCAAFLEAFQGRPCPDGFRYTSDNNTAWLTPEAIRELIDHYYFPAAPGQEPPEFVA